jgi:hypothetical protein
MHDEVTTNHDEVTIPLGDSLVPTRPDQPLPPDIGHIRVAIHLGSAVVCEAEMTARGVSA